MKAERAMQGNVVPRWKAVLFDFGGTLDADGVPSVGQFLRAYRALGGQRSAGEFEAIFRESDRELASDPATRRLGFRATIAAQSRILASIAGNTERLDASLLGNTVFELAAATASRNVRLLESIHVAGSRIAVVSNFTGNLELCLAELRLLPMVDAVVDSAVVGIRKPDSAIFTLALEQLGVEPSRALMVGDNPFADVRPATALGMATCWVAPVSRAVPDGCAPSFRVAALPELLSYLAATDGSAASSLTTCTG